MLGFLFFLPYLFLAEDASAALRDSVNGVMCRSADGKLLFNIDFYHFILVIVGSSAG